MLKVNYGSKRVRNRKVRNVKEQHPHRYIAAEPSAFNRIYARTFIYTIATLLSLAAIAVTTISASWFYVHQDETPDDLLK